MNVAALKRLLADLPDDALVLVPGYEDGLTEALKLSVGPVAHNPNAPSYYGEWDRAQVVQADSRIGVAIVPNTDRPHQGAWLTCDLGTDLTP